MELEIDERNALIGCGFFLVLGLGIWIGRMRAEADLMLQIEEFQANGGKIILPEPKTINITPLSIETIE